MDGNDLENRFTYHVPKDEHQVLRYETIRERGKKFAKVVDNLCMDSREKSIAMTKIEEAVMWANSAIARNE